MAGWDVDLLELGGRVVGWMNAESAPWRMAWQREFTVRRWAAEAARRRG